MRLLTLAACMVLAFSACDDKSAKTITTDLGNRYTIKTDGSGEDAAPGEYVYFHVIMRTEGDSTLFATRDNEGPVPVLQVAPMTETELDPVQDVVRYLGPGDEVEVRVNIEEFPTRPPGLENDTVVLYDIEVIEVLGEEEFAARQAEEQAKMEAELNKVREREPTVLKFAEDIRQQYANGTLDGVQTTPSGLKYVIHEAGNGAQASPGKTATVQYVGQLVENGNVFDQSFARGRGIPVQVGARQVIPGWDEGLALFNEGTKATLFIPSEQGYGTNGTPDGSIPPDSELAFYVELEKVQ